MNLDITLNKKDLHFVLYKTYFLIEHIYTTFLAFLPLET